ncbi:MAG: 2,3-bisphosphoglycerate-independent phosphoglycerate mutase [Acidimicrobiia bacterium]
MKYVVCVPDGCADEPVDELGGRTPLEYARLPVLSSIAARATVGRAQTIPVGLPPGSDVGNMAIFGYDPARYHTGRAPIEAAALRLDLTGKVAYRCNLVTVGADGTMVDFAGGHPDNDLAGEVIKALDAELGGEVSFHPGVQYRHIMLAPPSWAEADCHPPHDLTGQPALGPSGASAARLQDLMDRSRGVLARFDVQANQIWLWGQGPGPDMPRFEDRFGLQGGLCTEVDLVRGLGVLAGLRITEVEGANAWYDTNYEGMRDAAIAGLRDGTDLWIVHIEASDEAGHAGDVEEKVKALENWDRRVLAGLVDALDELGPWRMLLLPDHATPLRLKTHTPDPVPYLLFDSTADGPGGHYTEAATAGCAPVVAHQLMGALLQR